MKNILKFYYDISYNLINEHDEYAVISDYDIVYILKIFNGDINSLNNIYQILFNNRQDIHEIVLNKEQRIITEFDNKKYVLLKINNPTKLINSNFFYIPMPKVEVDVPKLWSIKIDSYIEKISNLYPLPSEIIDSFNYYVGLGENAISLYNHALKIDGEVVYSISHRRIYYPNYAINYNDPTDMLIDVRVRDLSEYIKQKFFKSGFSIDEFDSITSKYNLNRKEVNILYARLFYPNYYFDLLDGKIISDENIKKIIEYISKSSKYEELLLSIHDYYRLTTPVFLVDWLKDQH